MTKPKYFFQGFPGALKVLQMMIYFPELKFLIKENQEIVAMNITNRTSDGLSRCIIHSEKNLFAMRDVIITHEDAELKIFVAPESEAFFENVDADYDGSTGKTIYMPERES